MRIGSIDHIFTVLNSNSLSIYFFLTNLTLYVLEALLTSQPTSLERDHIIGCVSEPRYILKPLLANKAASLIQSVKCEVIRLIGHMLSRTLVASFFLNMSYFTYSSSCWLI